MAAVLGTVRSDFGTFAGATTGATVTGKGISYRLDGTFVGTVVVEFQDNFNDDFVVSRTDTAPATNMPIVINDNVVRNWRVRCSAYTSGSPKYSIQALPYTYTYASGGPNPNQAI
jgi:hypothetical protein